MRVLNSKVQVRAAESSWSAFRCISGITKDLKYLCECYFLLEVRIVILPVAESAETEKTSEV